jgi:hypothetical protein
MEKEPGQQKKPKKAQKKGIDNTPQKDFLRANIKLSKYCWRVNSYIFMQLGYIIRAEMVRRGITYKGLAYLLNDEGVKVNSITLKGAMYGTNNSWRLSIVYFSAYVLKIDLRIEDITKAKEFLLSSGRSVKEL